MVEYLMVETVNSSSIMPESWVVRTPLLSTNNGSSTSPALTSVVVCMTIMAISAVFYFAIRCYFEEKRLRASAMLCKCLPSVRQANLECGTLCTYSERRAVSTAVQTSFSQSPWMGGRMPESQRICTFSSPLIKTESVPCRRPPVSGSSRNGGYHSQRRYRRSRPPPAGPSIAIQTPSSNDSYSLLTMSNYSAPHKAHDVPIKAYDIIDSRNLTGSSLSSSDEDVGVDDVGEDAYHPRYNTPVSDRGDDFADAAGKADDDARDAGDAAGADGRADDEEKEEAEVMTAVGGGDADDNDGQDVDSQTERDVVAPGVDGVGDVDRLNPDGMADQAMPTGLHQVNRLRLAHNGAGDADDADASFKMRRSATITDAVGGGAFFLPAFEILPGGKLVNRWTQTEVGSLLSLDWDPFPGNLHLRGADGPDATLMDSEATLLQASRSSRRSVNSPYVLCYGCGEDFSLSDERIARSSPRNSSLLRSHPPPLPLQSLDFSDCSRDYEIRRFRRP